MRTESMADPAPHYYDMLGFYAPENSREGFEAP